jgi:hypothetical protein
VYAVKLAEVDPRRALQVPATHPVGALYYERPWLRDLPTVRMFFRLALAVYGTRIDASLESDAPDPGDVDLRRALMFFRNTRTDVKVGSELFSLHDLYDESLRIIDDPDRVPLTPDAREEALEAFVRAAATLFHHVRLTRPPSRPR